MFLSIIIPVYNCDEYIGECLDSCLTQNIDKDDYEIICVNDGSTDKSVTVIEEYIKRFNNISLINQPNSGVSTARNNGIEAANGDYVWFIDGDDFIDENILSDLKFIAEKNNSDRIKVQSYIFTSALDDARKEKKKNHTLKSNYPYKNSQITRTLLKREYINNHNIRFYKELSYGEDTVFNYETRIYNPKDSKYKAIGYYYRQHPGATTALNSELKVKKYINSCKVAFDITNDYYKKNIAHKETENMLVYWLEITLKLYSLNKSTLNWFMWSGEGVEIRSFDFRLKKVNSIAHEISVTKDTGLLDEWKKKYDNRHERRSKLRWIKKQIIQYIRHPKRIIKKILKH